MKHTFDLQFRTAHPETIGETDKEFDTYNYIEWLEGEYVDAKTKAKASDAELKHNKVLNIADVSHRRELLINFMLYLAGKRPLEDTFTPAEIDEFLKINQ